MSMDEIIIIDFTTYHSAPLSFSSALAATSRPKKGSLAMTTILIFLISFTAGAISLAISVLVIDCIERRLMRRSRPQKKDDWS